MRQLWRGLLFIPFLLAVPSWAEGPPEKTGSAAVVTVDDAGLDGASVRTLRNLTLEALEHEGLHRVDSQELALAKTPAEAASAVSHAGGTRLFVLSLRRLGSKLWVELEERSMDGSNRIFAATLKAMDTDTLDAVVPRLVKAVSRRLPVEETAEVSTVTGAEGQPYVKLPGENHFVLGAPIGFTSGTSSFGISLGYTYETERYRLGFTALGAWGSESSAYLLAMTGGYYFMTGPWSPYVDVGAGYMGIDSAGGAGFTAELGVELFRLHRTHLLVGVQALLPAFTSSPYDDYGDAVSKSWKPYALLHLRLAF